MPNKQPSQSQQTPDPLAPFYKPFEAWQSVMDAHLERLDAAFGTVNKYEGRAIKQSAEAVDELSKLGKDALFYAGELAAEWRKLMLDSARRTAELVTPAHG